MIWGASGRRVGGGRGDSHLPSIHDSVGRGWACYNFAARLVYLLGGVAGRMSLGARDIVRGMILYDSLYCVGRRWNIIFHRFMKQYGVQVMEEVVMILVI